MSKLPTGTSLYYPYIHPRSLGSLKAALLYWDRVRRIVPRPLDAGGHVYDDNQDTRLLTDAGLLVATSPHGYGAGAAERFLKVIAPRLNDFRLSKEEAMELHEERHGVHLEKISPLVLPNLVSLGVAHLVGNWVSMRKELARLYMYCLASEMGTRMGTPLLCDSTLAAETGQALLFGEATGVSVDRTLVSLGVEMPDSQRMEDVPTSKFLEFAEKRSGERIGFRTEIEGILERASKATDHHEFEDYISTERKKIELAVSDYRAAVDEFHVGVVSSAAKLATPALAAAAIATMPISASAAAILAGVGLTISAMDIVAATRGKVRGARRSSPYHYLQLVRRRFG